MWWFTKYWALAILPLVLSCSAISPNLRSEALQDVTFEQLVHDPQVHHGQTVILGGYILEVRNLPAQTLITVLQAPLGFDDSPQSADKSRGRFVIVHKGYLDPEVYRKDRAITVAGQLVDLRTKEDGDCGVTACLAVQSIELHLWPLMENFYRAYPYSTYRYPYFYPYWPHRYYYRRYPGFW